MTIAVDVNSNVDGAASTGRIGNHGDLGRISIVITDLYGGYGVVRRAQMRGLDVTAVDNKITALCTILYYVELICCHST